MFIPDVDDLKTEKEKSLEIENSVLQKMINSIVSTLKINDQDMTQSKEFKEEIKKYEEMLWNWLFKPVQKEISLKEFEEKLKQNMPKFVDGVMKEDQLKAKIVELECKSADQAWENLLLKSNPQLTPEDPLVTWMLQLLNIAKSVIEAKP